MNSAQSMKLDVKYRARAWFFGLLPFLAAFLAATTMLIIGSANPGRALASFFLSPLSNAFYFGNMIDQAGMILLCALGFVLTWKLGVFNLGGEGQAYLSALVSVEFAIYAPQLAGPAGIFLAALIGAMVAGLLGLLVGFLREKLGISELIASFLMSAAIGPLLDFAISGPLRNTSSNFLSTPSPEPGYFLTALSPPSSLSVSIFLGPICALLMFWILKSSKIGYEIRLIGNNREFADSQGVKSGLIVMACLTISAAFHGLAGASAVFSSRHSAFVGLTSGLGWNGIAAALMGRGHPLGAIVGALLFAYIGAGAKAAMIYTDFTFELGTVIQGLVFLLVTLRFVRRRNKL